MLVNQSLSILRCSKIIGRYNSSFSKTKFADINDRSEDVKTKFADPTIEERRLNAEIDFWQQDLLQRKQHQERLMQERIIDRVLDNDQWEREFTEKQADRMLSNAQWERDFWERRRARQQATEKWDQEFQENDWSTNERTRRDDYTWGLNHLVNLATIVTLFLIGPSLVGNFVLRYRREMVRSRTREDSSEAGIWGEKEFREDNE